MILQCHYLLLNSKQQGLNGQYQKSLQLTAKQIKYLLKRQMSNQSQIINSPINTVQTAKQIEATLQSILLELQGCQKCGNYVRADQLKTIIQKLKRNLNEKRLQQMVQDHKREKKRLEKMNSEELALLSERWTNKFTDFNCQKEKLKLQMQQKHNQQLLKAKPQIEAQVSLKMKQSSECLNLRKIQEQMKKQKKYSQAHQIQQQIMEMQMKEKTTFQKQRQIKIHAILATLQVKFKGQAEALSKKLSSGEKQLIMEKQKQIQKMKLKHANSIKELVSQQGKQLLGEKGHIKSRVTVSACKSRSRLFSLRKQ